jgi:hypothetical protein
MQLTYEYEDDHDVDLRRLRITVIPYENRVENLRIEIIKGITEIIVALRYFNPHDSHGTRYEEAFIDICGGDLDRIRICPSELADGIITVKRAVMASL